MINKYSGITLVILAILSLIASWMIYKKHTKRFFPTTNNTYESRQLIKDIIIQPEAFASLDIMQNVMEKLSQKTTIEEDHITLALSPVINKDKRPLVTVPSDLEKQKRRAAWICKQANKLVVSMSFVSENEEYAVIADKFVRKGQIAVNDFEVLTIQSDKIQVKKQGVKCEIKVKSANLSQL